MADPGFSLWGGGAPTPEVGLFFNFVFTENCMKMKEFGLGGVPCTPLDPPMIVKLQGC